jgi:hypothetical protein
MHFTLEIIEDFLVAAHEKALDFIDYLLVLLSVAEPSARSEAAAEVIVEAGLLLGLPAPRLAAWDEREDFVEELKGVADVVGASVGAEVFGAVLSNLAREEHARKTLLSDGDVGVALVVSKPHIVGRAELLDEVALKDEGLKLAVHHHDLNVFDLGDEASDAKAVIGAGLEVAADAVPQIDGFADVKHIAGCALVDVAARAGGEGFKLLGNGVRQRAGWQGVP